MWLPCQRDYIIAADAGYLRLLEMNVEPDLVVGDFDSLGFVPIHPNVIQSPEEKDDTDMMIAVREGLKRGHRRFFIDGGLGGRLDQTLANCQILSFIAENGAQGFLLGHEMCATVIKHGSMRFRAKIANGDTVEPERISVFSVGDRATGVTFSGLKYPLENAVLLNYFPLGVSNEFTNLTAEVSVREGTLLIIWSGGLERIEAI